MLPLKRNPGEAKRKSALTISDAVLVAWKSVKDDHPDFPPLTYSAVENAWPDTRSKGKFAPFPGLHDETGIDPQRHAEATRRWLEALLRN